MKWGTLTPLTPQVLWVVEFFYSFVGRRPTNSGGGWIGVGRFLPPPHSTYPFSFVPLRHCLKGHRVDAVEQDMVMVLQGGCVGGSKTMQVAW